MKRKILKIIIVIILALSIYVSYWYMFSLYLWLTTRSEPGLGEMVNSISSLIMITVCLIIDVFSVRYLIKKEK